MKCSYFEAIFGDFWSIFRKLPWKLYFAGINFRECRWTSDFAGINFRERKKKSRNRESLSPRKFIPLKYPPRHRPEKPAKSLVQWHSQQIIPAKYNFHGSYRKNIYQKSPQKWRQKKRISPKFHVITKVNTRKISERHHSQKFIPATVNFGPRRSKVYHRESLYP